MSQNTQHLAEGTTLGHGKYRIVRFIGAGGFGCTYEAEFVAMRTRVAIKEFFVSACCNREASGAVSVGIVSQTALVGKLEEKFRREAQRLFKMQHPNIVRVSDIIEENGTSYYVMDYISGRSLQDVIDSEGPLSEARALRYIGQVMDALEYVHGEKMLHLDIKPANIMIDGKDRAILIDFGVSKQYDEVDGHNTSTIMGQTPGYAPPEQAGNSIRQFTPAADIYALGATLYTALTGQVPPSSNDMISGFARLAPLPAATSPSIKTAIGRMMQPNASNRPQSVAAARALLAAPAPPPVETVPAGGTPTAPFVHPSGAPGAPGAPAAPAPSGVETAPVNPVPSGVETAPVNPAASGVETAPVNPAPVGTRHVASASTGTQRINAPAPKSKKWLWAAVAAAAIAIGAAAYFLASSGKSSPEESTDPIAQADTIEVAEPAEPTHNVGLSEVVEQPTTEHKEPADPELVQPQSSAQPAQPEPVQPIDPQQTQPQAVHTEPTSTPPSATVQQSGNVKTITLPNGVTFKMVYVQDGKFEMGATAEQSNGYSPDSDEKPVHSVTLSGYWIGQTEVTQELWQAVMGANSQWSSSFGLGSKYPAYYISYTDCQEFIKKLNDLTGQHFRMPTEAEWEYAARGGNKSRGYIFSGSNSLGEVGWFEGNSGSKTHPVATKSPNELGIYDMSGNVLEWCSDWYGSYSSASQTNPTGPSTGSYRVNRGGSWNDVAVFCRAAYRNGYSPGDRYFNLGLRLAL